MKWTDQKDLKDGEWNECHVAMIEVDSVLTYSKLKLKCILKRFNQVNDLNQPHP